MAVEDSVVRDHLRAFVERVERLNEEKAAINADISDIYKEMKGDGFDTKVVKKIIADRAKDANERMEFEAVYELYAVALGMAPEPDFDEPRVHVQARVREAGHFAPEITQSQAAPQPESDLTNSSSLSGQVATHTPETANETPRNAAEAEGESPAQGLAEPAYARDGETANTKSANDAGASNGRTAAFDAVNAGSTPAPASNTVPFTPKPLRPHCLKPTACAGMGRKHCWACEKAMAEAGAA